MKVEITPEDLVRPLTGKHHLYTHRLDEPGDQVHRCTRSNGRDIIGLDMVDHVPDSIEPFLDGVMDLVMYGTDIVCHASRGRQVG